MLKFIDRKKVLRDIQWNFQLQRAKKNWKNFYHANIEIGYPQKIKNLYATKSV